MYQTANIDVEEKPMHTLIFDPPGEGPHPALIIAQHLPTAHEGLEKDPWQIDVGERYAGAGFVCAMPFLFHRWPVEAPIETKRDEFRDDWTVMDLQATFEFLAALERVDTNRIGIVGHCWGGRVAWLGACHNPQLGACAVFYGGRVKLPFADSGLAPITLASAINCPMLGIFGNEDVGPSPDDVNDYATALQSAGVEHAFHRYDDAGHGFQDFTNPARYRESQSEDAWDKAVSFFHRHLG